MRVLHEALEKALTDAVEPARAISAIIAGTLRAQGHECTRRDREEIAKRVATHLSGPTESGVLILGGDGPTLKLNLNEEDSERYLKALSSLPEEIVPKISKDLAHSRVRWLKRDIDRQLAPGRQERLRFEINLSARWGAALAALELFLHAATEAGASANEYLRVAHGERGTYLVEVLTRSHARACQVAREVMVLLEAGLADGAHARWRTLHEIEVVAALLSQHGEDLAERYYLHEVRDSLNAARQFNPIAPALGEEPLSEAELREMEEELQMLCARFGPEFNNEFGWAANVLKMANPRFNHLEHAADLGHLRAEYKVASYNVHATAKGANFRLGLQLADEPRLLAGPSNAGLEGPGKFAAYALLNISHCLLTIDTTVDSVVYCTMLLELYKDLEAKFDRAARKLARDEGWHQEQEKKALSDALEK